MADTWKQILQNPWDIQRHMQTDAWHVAHAYNEVLNDNTARPLFNAAATSTKIGILKKSLDELRGLFASLQSKHK